MLDEEKDKGTEQEKKDEEIVTPTEGGRLHPDIRYNSCRKKGHLFHTAQKNCQATHCSSTSGMKKTEISWSSAMKWPRQQQQ
eukprot:876791-Ditylum_brightwellii.AAC.1